MPKRPETSDVDNILTSAPTINSNNDAIDTAFDNTLSRDGSTPNAMGADLDMNSNDILNVSQIDVQGITVNGQGINETITAIEGAASSAIAAAALAENYASKPPVYKTVADLVADTTLSYTEGENLRLVAEDDVVLANTFIYAVAASGASDEHITTAGGVKLYVQASEDNVYHIKAFNAPGTPSDNTSVVVTALNTLQDGDTLDFDGMFLTLFNSITGVASGDATALADVPRLFQKERITLRNGTLAAFTPVVSGTKLRYPTTMTIDECTDITIRDMTFQSKGENYGDTDASSGLTSDERKEFAAQNGGHALLVVRSENTSIHNCNFRFCGSVGTFYAMSSHQTKLVNCFSNPASLGYAAYAADSWAGDTSVSGFASHYTSLIGCSAHKEPGDTYGSKGCVLSEDGDVTLEVKGGYYADAYPNGSARDIGYAFGCSSSQTIVDGAYVENCAAIGYTATTNGTDFSYLHINNVVALGLRKTVHQTEDTSVGEMYFKYSNIDARVDGSSGLWAGDGDLTREAKSYVAMPNDGNIMHGSFTQCTFTGATYGFINTSAIFGSLVFDNCNIETDGWLWNSQNIGSGSAGRKYLRGVRFNHCAIEDISAEASAYTSLTSSTVYTYFDLSTSTIKLGSIRDIETSTITTPGTFIERYAFPRDDAATEVLASSKTLYPDSAKIQSIDLSGAAISVLLPRPDKYKFMEFKIINRDGVNNIVVRDYLSNSLVTLSPGEACIAIGDGAQDNVYKL